YSKRFQVYAGDSKCDRRPKSCFRIRKPGRSRSQHRFQGSCVSGGRPWRKSKQDGGMDRTVETGNLQIRLYLSPRNGNDGEREMSNADRSGWVRAAVLILFGVLAAWSWLFVVSKWGPASRIDILTFKAGLTSKVMRALLKPAHDTGHHSHDSAS